jgi:hypothetical protein
MRRLWLKEAGLGEEQDQSSQTTVIGGKRAMIRPMNKQESTLGARCDACSDPATHCDSEMTDFPLLLCTAHAFEQALIYGGTVRTDISPISVSEVAAASRAGW